MTESGAQADLRRVNALLGADGVVRTPARLAGWVRSLVEAGLADIRRSGRGFALGADVLEFLDALQSAELSENGRIVDGAERIDIGDGIDLILNSSQAAALLECDARTVRRAFESGKLRGQKLGHEWVTTTKDLDDFRFEKRVRNG